MLEKKKIHGYMRVRGGGAKGGREEERRRREELETQPDTQTNFRNITQRTLYMKFAREGEERGAGCEERGEGKERGLSKGGGEEEGRDGFEEGKQRGSGGYWNGREEEREEKEGKGNRRGRENRDALEGERELSTEKGERRQDKEKKIGMWLIGMGIKLRGEGGNGKER